jgi:hypothetical protein
LHNKGELPVNISGWKLTDNNSFHRYVFPVKTLINPKDFIVVCREREVFKLYFPDIWNVIGNIGFGFGENGDGIRLYDSDEILIDSLSYGVSAPWPEEPNGSGPSLELMNPALENALAKAWGTSMAHGTPGKVNSNYMAVKDSLIIPTPFQMHTRLLQNYPNPFNVKTTVTYTISPGDSGMVHLALYNIKGQLIKTLVKKKVPFGLYHVTLQANNMASGTYYCRLTTKKTIKTSKIIVIR